MQEGANLSFLWIHQELWKFTCCSLHKNRNYCSFQN